ncbi:hypothetical protein D3H65_27825 [Paraflavitalea soli]|uniref:Uncharacterized protein n=1 Tax=Paraflavitalea soli TaxID=2315862 RepID=A0A3B7MSS7_9BACT|nr:hypothetical protein [Paraflavitalea soli]AXY77562.1 hypothetical protein D3H65_27825 [Paraflavitalea soli]
MNNVDQFEALTEVEAVETNGGGLLDLLYPTIIINDPLGLVGTLVDPIVTGALNAGQSIINGLTSAINNLLGSLKGIKL